MSFLGILKATLQFGLQLFGAIRGAEQKPTLSDLLPTIVANILPAVDQAITYQKLDTTEKLDSWLASLDAATGVESTAVDILKDLPADKEELFWDHIIEAARIYGYCRIGVEGFKGQ